MTHKVSAASRTPSRRAWENTLNKARIYLEALSSRYEEPNACASCNMRKACN